MNPAAMAAQLALGAVGGTVAWALGAPMPYLVGGLLATALAAIRADGQGLFGHEFPQPVRRYFTSIVGVMIGQRFSPDLLNGFSAYWMSLTGVALFVVIAQAVGYQLFLRVGGYDRTTAYFAAMPGGLIEAVTIGEKQGGDVRAISVQHFTRIILVVLIVPVMFLLWTGHTVGSAAGVQLDPSTHDIADFGWTVVIAGAGIVLGRALHLPAAVLIGPLLLSAVLQGTGLVDAAGPIWLLYTAQLVIGVGLGSAFSGISRAQLVKSLMMCVLSVSIYLCIGLVLALLLHRMTGLDLPALIISFIPGGVTEMSLVALSLSINPIIVATHHVFRILVTVMVMSVTLKLTERRGGP